VLGWLVGSLVKEALLQLPILFSRDLFLFRSSSLLVGVACSIVSQASVWGFAAVFLLTLGRNFLGRGVVFF